MQAMPALTQRHYDINSALRLLPDQNYLHIAFFANVRINAFLMQLVDFPIFFKNEHGKYLLYQFSFGYARQSGGG